MFPLSAWFVLSGFKAKKQHPESAEFRGVVDFTGNLYPYISFGIIREICGI